MDRRSAVRPRPPVRIVVDASAPAHAVPAFLGADVRLGPRHALACARAIATTCARSRQSPDFRVRPLPRHLPRRGRCLRRRRAGPAGLQLLLRRSDLRRPAGQRRAAVRRAELHAAQAGGHRRHRMRFWYKPNVSPPKDYAQWERPDHALRPAPGRSLRHRRGRAVVFRGLERAELDFWAGEPEAGDLLRALRPHGARAQGRQPAAARGRSGDGAGGLGATLSSSTAPQTNVPRRFRLHPRLRQRHGAGRLRHPREDSARRDGLPRGAEGSRRGRRHPPMPDLPLIWSEYNASYTTTNSRSPIPPTWARGWRTLSASATA